ncbi:PAS domain-containing protein [Vitiosangium sp. GDMCC 1.1324]|uniref:PAS domain-containing protein n=1 Tax=Vitiosangium sp. (strain GDMCC 1.1324) TaxID=2138576 RepID=UPI001E3723A9|nr:PAS domain-containing protein [Vitiosangium sp. GDMCC 1.1324]
MTDGILVVDGAWRLVWLNAVLERLLGRAREQLLGQELWVALPEVAESGFAPAWRRAMEARTLVSLEDFFAPAGAWLETRAFPSGEGLVVFARDVTERRLAENERVRLLSVEQAARTAVEGERARFQEMLMLAPAAVSITRGPEHRFVFSNLLHRRFYGSRDMVGQPVREALPELVGQGVYEVMDRVYASGNSYVGRARPVKVPRPGGAPEEMFFDIAYHPQRDAAGRVEGVAIFAYDVTDLVRSRRTAEALARDLGHSEERFRSLVTATSDIIWATPPSGEFVEDLPGWSAFTGQTREDLLGWGWLDAVHPEDRERTVRAWEDALSTRTSFQLEHRLRRHDGTYRHMLARAVPVMEADGTVREWVGAHRDITLQRQGEAERERLLAREQRHSVQLQGLASAALVISEADSIEHVLKAITEQAREVIGAHQALTSLTVDGNWAQAIHARSLSDKHGAWREWNERPEGTGIYSWVCRLNLPMRMTQAELEAHPAWRGFGRHKGKHPPLRGWLAAPLVGRDGRNLGLIQLSDRHEGDFSSEDEAILVQLARMASVAIENTRLMAETQAANRAKDEFLAVMSHELRTPLTAVLGWTQMLRNRQNDARAVEKGLAVIERNARTLAQLIEDVLDVSRIITGKLTLYRKGVELVGVVQAAVEVVKPHAEQKGVSLALEVEVGGNGSAMLVGDPGRLQQVLWNLLVNAVKFTPAGGRVLIRVDRAERELRVRVTDTGKGIRADFLPHLFERFWQADGSATREHGGLGLGLAIVHHLVGLHGGSVKAESAGEGKGSTFTVTLPVPAVLPEEQTEALPGAEVSAPGVKLDGVTVLLVEDAADARELIALMLRERGAVVSTASNSGEAMERLKAGMPDVLVSDIGLPGEDGHALLRKVRAWAEARDQWVPAIALTAYASAEDARRAYRAGFQVHLAKPLEPGAFIEAVARLAGRGDMGARTG